MSAIKCHEDNTHSQNSGLFYAARQALRRHATGGNILIFATIAALVVANIPGIKEHYAALWQLPVRLQIGEYNLLSHAGHPMTLMQVINDALMAIFFFSIGLEIKREILVGELSSLRNALLPIVAAVGGMAVPVLIFWLMSKGTVYATGAAIPMATDIAFTLGLLAMFSSRVPISLKVFLTTLAVVDDIGGIIVIATAYSDHVQISLLLIALGLLALLLLGDRLHIKSKIFYLTIGTAVWLLFLNSGIHPTIAGVLVALCIPARPVFNPDRYIDEIRQAIGHFHNEASQTGALCSHIILSHKQMDWLKEVESASDKVISPLQDLEDSLHPIVNFFIVPLFAFANAGIDFSGMAATDVVGGLSLAIIAGLVIGKFVGITLFSWGMVKLKLAPMPKDVSFAMLASGALLAGIGFTVSLFIANLSFDTPDTVALLSQAKLGIIVASLIAAICGMVALSITLPKREQHA